MEDICLMFAGSRNPNNARNCLRSRCDQATQAVAIHDRGGEITGPRYVISQGERHEASFP